MSVIIQSEGSAIQTEYERRVNALCDTNEFKYKCGHIVDKVARAQLLINLYDGRNAFDAQYPPGTPGSGLPTMYTMGVLQGQPDFPDPSSRVRSMKTMAICLAITVLFLFIASMFIWRFGFIKI